MIVVYLILILIIIPLIIAFFIKKDYNITREVLINKPLPNVFNYIKFLKNQGNYSKWALMDPDMKNTYSGVDGTVGFVSAWESENKQVGTGEQEIKKIIENQSLEFELRFIKPFKATHKAYMNTDKVSDYKTRVLWGFDGEMKYPMNLMLLFMNFDKMIGDDLEVGLKNLKELLEKE